MLGFVQWPAAGTIAGLGGEHTAVPMALLMITGAALSMAGLLVLARSTRQIPAGTATVNQAWERVLVIDIETVR
ncbi:hypothetical protein ACIA5D_32630 [Actinoplanes sp. NPDC051513]|uniref:hypothetical protein n=1 Tax=Actinoplanes sp. NPDC051513 TaxID=3363908 RepID=UPI0037B7C3ED